MGQHCVMFKTYISPLILKIKIGAKERYVAEGYDNIYQ